MTLFGVIAEPPVVGQPVELKFFLSFSEAAQEAKIRGRPVLQFHTTAIEPREDGRYVRPV